MVPSVALWACYLVLKRYGAGLKKAYRLTEPVSDVKRYFTDEKSAIFTGEIPLNLSPFWICYQ
jgi:hypothetical protein